MTPITPGRGGLSLSNSCQTPRRVPMKLTDEVFKSKTEDGYKSINEHIMLQELGRGTYGKVKLSFNTISNQLNVSQES